MASLVGPFDDMAPVGLGARLRVMTAAALPFSVSAPRPDGGAAPERFAEAAAEVAFDGVGRGRRVGGGHLRRGGGLRGTLMRHSLRRRAGRRRRADGRGRRRCRGRRARRAGHRGAGGSAELAGAVPRLPRRVGAPAPAAGVVPPLRRALVLAARRRRARAAAVDLAAVTARADADRAAAPPAVERPVRVFDGLLRRRRRAGRPVSTAAWCTSPSASAGWSWRGPGVGGDRVSGPPPSPPRHWCCRSGRPAGHPRRDRGLFTE